MVLSVGLSDCLECRFASVPECSSIGFCGRIVSDSLEGRDQGLRAAIVSCKDYGCKPGTARYELRSVVWDLELRIASCKVRLRGGCTSLTASETWL
jgi:hypothetical protein